MVMTCEQAHRRGDAEQDGDYQPLEAAVMPGSQPVSISIQSCQNAVMIPRAPAASAMRVSSLTRTFDGFTPGLILYCRLSDGPDPL